LTDEERYTFSSLMSFLIGTEEKLERFYETTAEWVSEGKLKSLLSAYAKNSLRRMQMMRKARVETVVEMTLGPITGLKLAEPLAEINVTIENGRISNVEKAMLVEKTVCDLYVRASSKIMQISAETGELLREMSRESGQRVHELEQYVRSA